MSLCDHRLPIPDDGFGSALLVTADGAVDTSMDPNKQELITASLHYCEIVAALGETIRDGVCGVCCASVPSAKDAVQELCSL